MRKRVMTVFCVASLLTLALIVRLINLQVLNSQYKIYAVENSRYAVKIPASRGSILDTKGKVLAQSVKINVCYMVPENIQDHKAAAKQFAQILSLDEIDVQKKMEQKGAVLLKKDLTKEETEEIEKLDSSDVFIKIENGRYYPNEDLAAHLLGFTNIDNEGSYGLELSYDKILSGVPGKEMLSRSISGERVSYKDEMVFSETPGETIVTTIDLGIQEILYQRGKEAFESMNPKELILVAMNPNNGDILGMQAFPNFNSNHPRDIAAKQSDQTKKLSEDELLQEYFKLWNNPCISNMYEPGSVFKLITLSAALEENTTDDSHVYYCDGFVHDLPGEFDVRCWSWNNPHGTQDISHALTNSCNPAFVQIARELGKEKLYEYIIGFGFGELTGIELPGETYGEMPKSIDEIRPLELATLSFGHGIATTPIQTISAVSAVVNGGKLYRPRIVKETLNSRGEVVQKIPIVEKRQVISENTSTKMRNYMQRVIDDGIGIVQIPGYNIGGKTGTTVKLVDGKYDDEYRLHSFVSTFPADKPDIVLLAMMDESFQGLNPNLTLTKWILSDIISYKKYESKVQTGE